MKYLIIAFFFLSPTIIFSQSEKEKVYILFNETSKETCNKEDGSGNLLTIKMYRKEKGLLIFIFVMKNLFSICQKTKKIRVILKFWKKLS